jgi:3-isopropylmalate/(R)-2-methylmalate dehydratase small subunit
MQLEGKVWKYGDNIDTDVIIPARYLVTTDPQQLAQHCMEDADTSFAKNVQPGDVMVGGANFGCGSSREHAPISIKGAGISCIVAESFARIFFRNAINIGLPIMESPEAARDAQAGDTLQINLTTGAITNTRTGKTYQAKPFPPFVLDIIQAGGLVEYTRNTLGIEI